MVEEITYSYIISKHDNWHKNKSNEPIIDISCPICYGIEKEETSEAFLHCWEQWIIPRCCGNTYTQFTYSYYCKIQNSPNWINTILQLLKTVRYQSNQPSTFFFALAERINHYY